MEDVLYLNELKENRITMVKRTLDLIMFGFETPKKKEMCLHTQCFIRIFESDKLIISSDDLYRPSKFLNDKEFKWDIPGDSLFDDEIKKHNEKLLSSVVNKILYKNKDLHVFFENGLRLEILVNTTEDDEMYRIFERHSDKEFVVYSCF